MLLLFKSARSAPFLIFGPPLTVSESDSPESTALWCSFFYLSLSTQRKVTRPSADGLNARRVGERPSDIARINTEATG
jgi:hypothetical protein